MPNCSAVGCTNRSTDRPELSFHKLPSKKKPKLRNEWLQNIRRAGKLPQEQSFFICSEHFRNECFVRDLQVCLCLFIFLVFVYLFRFYKTFA